MPFKSEAQRRYLWANEPEIARDWTDTYGSRIQKRMGGVMQLVKENKDGSRPGYRGSDWGDEARGRGAYSAPAGGASAHGNYGGDKSGGVSPNQMSGAGSFTRDRPNPHTISGTSKATFVSPSRISTSPQFTQEGRDTFIQNLRGPTLGQRIGQGIGNLASGVGNYITSGGMWGALARGLGSLFGPKSSPRELGIMNQYLGPGGSTLSIGRNDIPMSREERDTPWWMQLGYPSYEAWAAAQNQGIEGIELDDDAITSDDIALRFIGADRTLNPQAVGLENTDQLREMIQERVKNLYT